MIVCATMFSKSHSTVANLNDESSRLLASSGDHVHLQTPPVIAQGGTSVLSWVLLGSLLGSMIMNLDFSFNVSLYAKIGSSFQQMHNSEWLLLVSPMILIVFQPLGAQLSLIYSPNAVLLCAYSLFGLGQLVGATSASFWQVLCGRIISSLGSSCMSSIVIIVLKDSVPANSFALFEGFKMCIDTIGLLGGSSLMQLWIGYFDWHNVYWVHFMLAFVPALFLLATSWRAIYRPNDQSPTHHVDELQIQTVTNDVEEAFLDSWPVGLATTICDDKPLLSAVDNSNASSDLITWKIDHWGVLILPFLAISVAFCARSIPTAMWTGFVTPLTAISTVLLLCLFLWVETSIARYPIVPTAIIFTRKTGFALLTHATLQMGLSSMSFLLPLEQQINRIDDLDSVVATTLSAKFLGSPFGAVLGGIIIKRTETYKPCILVGLIGVIVFYVLHSYDWNDLDSGISFFALFVQGMAEGLSDGSLMLAVISSTIEQEKTRVLGAVFFESPLAAMIAVAITSAMVRQWVSSTLTRNLPVNIPNGESIVNDALKDIRYISKLHIEIRNIVADCFKDSIKKAYIFSAALVACAFFSALFIDGSQLIRSQSNAEDGERES